MLRGAYAHSLELLRSLPLGSHGSSVTALIALNLHYLDRTDEGWRVFHRAKPDDRTESDFASVKAIFHALAGERDEAEASIAVEVATSHSFGHYHHAECYIA